MRPFVREFVDTKGAVGSEAGGLEQVLSLEFIGKLVDHCLSRQSRVVEHDGDDHDENAQKSEKDEDIHGETGVAEDEERDDRADYESQHDNEAKQ